MEWLANLGLLGDPEMESLVLPRLLALLSLSGCIHTAPATSAPTPTPPAASGDQATLIIRRQSNQGMLPGPAGRGPLRDGPPWLRDHDVLSLPASLYVNGYEMESLRREDCVEVTVDPGTVTIAPQDPARGLTIEVAPGEVRFIEALNRVSVIGVVLVEYHEATGDRAGWVAGRCGVGGP